LGKSRDNARTPMQWDAGEHAGFTTGTPWIAVNPNYTTINAEAELQDPNSVFHYYKKLIALRKEYPVVVYGKYELLLPEDKQIFAYTRTLENEKLLVVCNFTDKGCRMDIPDEFCEAECLISNYNGRNYSGTVELEAYEAFVLKK
jgi:oligo-1,6-glucosidase